MLDLTKPLQTRDGRPVRIYAKDGAETYPIHGAWQSQAGKWIAETWGRDGATSLSNNDHQLINVPQKIHIEGWLNVYPCKSGMLHLTKERANDYADSDRIACIHIDTWATMGDGLT